MLAGLLTLLTGTRGLLLLTLNRGGDDSIIVIIITLRRSVDCIIVAIEVD